MRTIRRAVPLRPLAVALVAAGVGLLAACTPGTHDEPAAARASSASVVQTPAEGFAVVARVLRHPRCLNCHPAGDRPRVGDDARLHAMEVQRGPANHGVDALRCDACHRDANQPLAELPGAPHWSLAPRSMGWEGLDDHALAAALRDPATNGGRSLDDVLRHVTEDPLVLWGWDPGPGRSPVPVPHDAFVDALRTWIEGGAPSPEPGIVTTF